MRAAAIFGPGTSNRQLESLGKSPEVSWQMGLPARTEDCDAIVIFGGDGTLHRLLPKLAELRLPVLVVPCGSGNDFARALGLRSAGDARGAWSKFVESRGNVREADLGRLGEHYFCTVAGVGIDTEVARRANRLPRWMRGNGGYALSLLPVIFQFAALPMRIRAAGRPDERFKPTVLAAFANVPAYGGGMKIAPHARMDDGRLDVCLIQDINKFKLLCLFPSVYFGRHLGIKEVEYFQADRLRLESQYPLEVYADGEYVCQTPVDVGVERGALRVIVP
jgi:diacylglycerol kinase (ATP)